MSNQSGNAKFTVIAFLLVAVLGAYHFLYRNQQTYYVVIESGLARAEQGTFSLGGSEPMRLKNEIFKGLFAEIETDMPSSRDSYENIFELMDAWFPIIENNIEKEINSSDWDVARVEALVGRVEIWPGLDADKREKLIRWQGELSYFRAIKMIATIRQNIKKARYYLNQSINSGSRKSEEATKLLDSMKDLKFSGEVADNLEQKSDESEKSENKSTDALKLPAKSAD